VIQGVEVVLETDMSNRQKTLVCSFDPRSPRISAHDIHEWIYDTLRLPEEDITMVQIDGLKRRVFIKFSNEARMEEILKGTEGKCVYKHDTGERSQVTVEIAGMRTKRIRIAGLPPEVKEATICESLNKYGETVNIRNETWAAAYRYKVSNGIRVVELKLKKHLPSYMSIAGNDVQVSYVGQPPTCFRCNEPRHVQVECPRRKRLDKNTSDTQSSWADIVSNETRDTQQYRQTSQTVNDTADRQENAPRTGNENTTLNTGQAQNNCDTDIEQASRMDTGKSPFIEKEDPTMDTRKTPTSLIEAMEQGEGSDAKTTQKYGKEKRDYSTDRVTGGTRMEKTQHSSPEQEDGSAESTNTYDNSGDGTNSTAIFQTTSNRPKKLKTEDDDPTIRNRNRSKTRLKNPTK